MHDACHVFPVGPQHPLLHEPLFLKLEVEGSYIKHVGMNLGYVHRGIEKVLEGKTIEGAQHSVERTCGICSFAHSGAMTRGIEYLAGIEVPKKVDLQRVIIAELERIHSHIITRIFSVILTTTSLLKIHTWVLLVME